MGDSVRYLAVSREIRLTCVRLRTCAPASGSGRIYCLRQVDSRATWGRPMELAIQVVAILAPVGSAALGYFAALRTEDKRLERDRQAREGRRKVEREARWAAFQRETLIELQDEVHNFVRAHGAIHHHDVMISRQEGEWTTRPMLPAEINDEAHRSGVAIVKLASRVDDADVRTEVQAIKDATLPVGLTTLSEQASLDAMLEATEYLERFHERAGELIRSLPV